MLSSSCMRSAIAISSVTTIACTRKHQSNMTSLKQRGFLCDEPQRYDSTVDVIIIGAGVVGLAVAREAAIQGLSVICIEKEHCIANGASGGNSGLGCTGYDAPPGSLESKLLRRSIRRHPNIYRSFGLSYEHVQKSGSLVVAWDEEQLRKLSSVLKENRDAGDEDARMVDVEELREIEPNLSICAKGAVLCPYEAIVEPWLVPVGYAESALTHGAHIFLNTKVIDANFDLKENIWKVKTNSVQINHESIQPTNRSLKGDVICKHKTLTKIHDNDVNKLKQFNYKAKVVVNCSGVYGGEIEQLRVRGIPTKILKEEPEEMNPIIMTPRKGQFAVYKRKNQLKSNQESLLLNHIIEPVATEFTKGVIVWQTLHGNLIVGPTAEPQESKVDRSTNLQTLETLHKYGASVLPCLESSIDGWELQGSYACLRPATQYRDYQIKAYPQSQWISVSGIRSTGLSACSGIAEYVNELLSEVINKERIAYKHEDVKGVSESTSKLLPLSPYVIPNSQSVPKLATLAHDYNTTGDGTVGVYGKRWRVTHPIASFGFESSKR